jgi:hypothetical protein
MSVDYYYLCYEDSIEKLLWRIDISKLHCVNLSIDCKNDVLLVHAIYQTAKTKHLYRKRKIRGYLWKRMRLSDEYRQGFNELFNFCWKQNFSIRESDGERHEKLAKVIYSMRPLYLRLIDNNITILIFTLAFVWLQYQISIYFHVPSSWEWVKVAMALFYGATAGEVMRNYKYLPLVCFWGYMIFALMGLYGVVIYSNPRFSYANLARADVIKALSYLLWYPVIMISEDRIKDLRS